MWGLFSFILKIIGAVLGLAVIYVGVSLVLSFIPIHRDFQSVPDAAEGTDVYIRSNGVHTDLVLPMTSGVRDWRGVIPAQDLHNEAGELNYISFGWGDKGFYLETPTWADLKASTAFVAAFGLGSTAMHVEAVAQPKVGDMVRRVRVTDAQLAMLVAHVDQSFVYDAFGRIQKINTQANYNEHDAFYEAVGRYSIFTTCNEWTRAGLSAAGIKTVVFSPHDAGVLRYLPQ